MNEHLQLGIEGESLAEAWLIEKNYTILHKNWRSGRHEVDIIASKKNCLHFIEVKTRSSFQMTNPEDRVNAAKLKNLKEAAMKYLEQNPQWSMIQFDVLSIVKMNDKVYYYFIEDVF